MIRVVMSGAGNMGRQIMTAIEAADDLELVGALDGLSDELQRRDRRP